MSYAAHHKDFGSFVRHPAAPKGDAVSKKASILRRILDAFEQSRQREVDRHIAHFLDRSGRAFTDDLEREITSRVLTSNWNVHAGPFTHYPRTTRFGMAMPEASVDLRAREGKTTILPAAIASRWTELRSAWIRRLARRRLQRSIAHLNDRLLADIGLGPQDLGFAQRFVRSHPVGGDIWAAPY